MLANELREIVSEIPIINPNRNYWFIRTEGGLFYNKFIHHNVIAIGYNEISTDKVSEVIKTARRPKKALMDYIKKSHPSIKRPGLAASQLLRFITEIRQGDVVVIPGINSTELSFGIVTASSTINYDFPIEENQVNCNYSKAKSVEWVKTVRRSTLNPELYSMFFARQTIVNGQDYAAYIDSTINDIYTKNGKTHLVVRVTRNQGIYAHHLFNLGLQLLEVTDQFLQENQISEDTEKVEVKTHLNSPGFFELAGYATEAVVTVALLMVAVSGGDFISDALGIKMKTPGILKALSSFLNDKQKRELLAQLSSELQTKESKDLLEIIKKMK